MSDLPSVNKHIDDLKSAMMEIQHEISEIARWIWQNVVADDVFPQRLPEEISESLGKVNNSGDEIMNNIRILDERIGYGPAWKLICKNHLTKEEFYFLRSQGLITFTEGGGSDPEYETYCEKGL